MEYILQTVMDSELEEEDGTTSYEMFPALCLSKTSSSGIIANGNQEDRDAHVKEGMCIMNDMSRSLYLSKNLWFCFLK